MNIPPEDYYRQKLTEVKCMALQWADNAKKVHSTDNFISLSLFPHSLPFSYSASFSAMQVAADSGALPLDKVFELVLEGENLPVRVEKELKVMQ